MVVKKISVEAGSVAPTTSATPRRQALEAIRRRVTRPWGHWLATGGLALALSITGETVALHATAPRPTDKDATATETVRKAAPPAQVKPATVKLAQRATLREDVTAQGGVTALEAADQRDAAKSNQAATAPRSSVVAAEPFQKADATETQVIQSQTAEAPAAKRLPANQQSNARKNATRGIYLSLGDKTSTAGPRNSKDRPQAEPGSSSSAPLRLARRPPAGVPQRTIAPQASLPAMLPSRPAVAIGDSVQASAPESTTTAALATESRQLADPSQFKVTSPAAFQTVKPTRADETANVLESSHHIERLPALPADPQLEAGPERPFVAPAARLTQGGTRSEVNTENPRAFREPTEYRQAEPSRFALRQADTRSPREQLNAVVKHVTSPAYTYRLPPVEPIPAVDAAAETRQFAVQPTARLTDASVVRPALVTARQAATPQSSARQDEATRARQTDDITQREVLDQEGLPLITSIGDLNPLSRLPARKNEKDLELPNPFAQYRERLDSPLLSQNAIRLAATTDGLLPWGPSYGVWEAPAFAHRPLYFEEVNLERYGHYVPRLQPALSAAHFVTNLATLPYQALMYRPCEPVYTLGHHRPGSCHPHQIHYLPAYR